jgi:hypothetical protein
MSKESNFYTRLNQLAGIKQDGTLNEENGLSTLVDYKRSDDGAAFGIIKENHKYFIKRSPNSSDKLVAEDFAYIGGLENKNEYSYPSLAEASKNREFYIKSINESLTYKEETTLNEGQEKKEEKFEGDVNAYLRNRINESKKNIDQDRKNRFLKEHNAVNEGDISTADSDQDTESSVANHSKDPLKKSGKSEIVADSEISDSDDINNKKDREEPQSSVTDKKHHGGKDAGSGDLSTQDSDQSEADQVDNKTTKEKPQAKYNNYNQPEMGHKEEKGVELKPVASKKDIVAEAAEAGAESGKEEQPESDPFDDKEHKGEETGDIVAEGEKEEQPESDPFADKEEAGDEKGDIVADGSKEMNEEDLSTADSELDSLDSLANLVKAELTKSGEDHITADSELDAADSMANKVGVREEDLSTKDSEQGEPISNADTTMTYNEGELEDGVSFDADENAIAKEVSEDEEGGEESDIDAAADALADLEQAPAEEPAQPEAEGGEKAPAEEPAQPEGDSDAENPAILDKEIEKLVGKLGEKVRKSEMQPSEAKGYLKSVLSSFEDHISEFSDDEKKELADKILKGKDTPEDVDGGEEAPAPEAGGEEAEMDSAIDDAISDASSGEGGEEAPKEEGFKGHLKEMGYDLESIHECGEEDMAHAVSSHANKYMDGEVDGDHKIVAMFVSPEIAQKLVDEYGHSKFMEELDPYMKDLDEKEKISYGMTEPMPEMNEDDADLDIDGKLMNLSLGQAKRLADKVYATGDDEGLVKQIVKSYGYKDEKEDSGSFYSGVQGLKYVIQKMIDGGKVDQSVDPDGFSKLQNVVDVTNDILDQKSSAQRAERKAKDKREFERTPYFKDMKSKGMVGMPEGEKKDHDGDGDIDSDDYMAAKDKAIKKSMGKDVDEAKKKLKMAKPAHVLGGGILGYGEAGDSIEGGGDAGGEGVEKMEEAEDKMKRFIKYKLEEALGLREKTEAKTKTAKFVEKLVAESLKGNKQLFLPVVCYLLNFQQLVFLQTLQF